VDELDELFKQYIARVTRGDEPFAMTLSGGVDSSLLATYVPKDTTCVTWGGWGKVGTDIDYSRMVSEKLGLKRHIVVPYEVEQDQELYDDALKKSPTPFMYTLGVSFLRMAHTLQKELGPSYKLLIGQNADTISGAYKTTIATHFLSRLAKITQYLPFPERLLWQRRKLAMLASQNPFVGFAFHHSTSLYPSAWLDVPENYFPNRITELEVQIGKSYSRFNDAIIAELIQIESRRAQFAGHVLASYHGAKTLAPFYDPEIVRLMMSVPFRIRRMNGFGKQILRTLALRRGVPEEVVKLKTKKGLSYNYKTFITEGLHIPIWNEIEKNPVIGKYLNIKAVRSAEEKNYFTMDLLRSLHRFLSVNGFTEI
jgi:asparagine synthetase B (glutamine-hydrolysing)